MLPWRLNHSRFWNDADGKFTYIESIRTLGTMLYFQPMTGDLRKLHVLENLKCVELTHLAYVNVTSIQT